MFIKLGEHVNRIEMTQTNFAESGYCAEIWSKEQIEHAFIEL